MAGNIEIPPTRKLASSESEFGGGPGMIDSVRRRARTIDPLEGMWEIYATNPSVHDSGGANAVATVGPENLPESATVERP